MFIENRYNVGKFAKVIDNFFYFTYKGLKPPKWMT